MPVDPKHWKKHTRGSYRPADLSYDSVIMVRFSGQKHRPAARQGWVTVRILEQWHGWYEVVSYATRPTYKKPGTVFRVLPTHTYASNINHTIGRR